MSIEDWRECWLRRFNKIWKTPFNKPQTSDIYFHLLDTAATYKKRLAFYNEPFYLIFIDKIRQDEVKFKFWPTFCEYSSINGQMSPRILWYVFWLIQVKQENPELYHWRGLKTSQILEMVGFSTTSFFFLSYLGFLLIIMNTLSPLLFYSPIFLSFTLFFFLIIIILRNCLFSCLILVIIHCQH